MTPETILAGLSPDLIVDLAGCAGLSLPKLEVQLQLLPWGDRATLAAYGVVVLDEVQKGRHRRLHVTPLALDVVATATKAVIAAADPA